jgi:hypothetical protein
MPPAWSSVTFADLLLPFQMSVTPIDSLPTEHDFDPWGRNLDAQNAWRNFGGLTLDEAHAKFHENPLNYQEDFMFMGGRAFAYYFPVVEDHLRSDSKSDGDDDREAWILAHCIRMQFDSDNLARVRHLAQRVIELAEFVRDNLHRFGADDSERQRVADAWTELVDHIEAAMKPPSNRRP